MKSLQGHLLIAAPTLVDPNFFRSVVLVVQHGVEGALGVILNRPSQTSVREAWEQVRDSPCGREERLFLGGPCQGPLMALHQLPLWSEVEVASDLHFSASPENLEHLVASEDPALKFFVGYSGWGGGQLEQELQIGSWEVLPATVQHVFQYEAHLWEQTLREAAGERFFSALKIKHRPEDPRLN